MRFAEPASQIRFSDLPRPCDQQRFFIRILLPFYEFLFDFAEYTSTSITFFNYDYRINITFFNIKPVV